MVSRKREIKFIINIDGKLRDIIIRLNNKKDLAEELILKTKLQNSSNCL